MLVMALGAALAVTGCGSKGRVSTSELRSNFKSAEPAMQSLVDKAVAAVNSNNYPEALSNLQTLSHKARLTVDQEQALKDTIAAVQKHMADANAQKPVAPSKPATEPEQILDYLKNPGHSDVHQSRDRIPPNVPHPGQVPRQIDRVMF